MRQELRTRAREACSGWDSHNQRHCLTPAAVGTLCIHHMGLLTQPLTLTAVGSQLYVFAHLEPRTERSRNRPIIGWAAVELAKRGVLARAMFLDRGGRRILRRIARAGVAVIPEAEGDMVRVYRFELAALERVDQGTDLGVVSDIGRDGSG